MLLAHKTAVIYGGGGSIGGAVARAFAREGAHVVVSGRTRSALDAVADDIRASGGTADTDIVDALDEAAVDTHADVVVDRTGSYDVCFCAINHDDVQGTPLVEMTWEDFVRPVEIGLRSTFITAKAAARHMKRQGSGVILSFGGRGDPLKGYHLGGLQVGLTAIDVLCRQLASELGPHGIRVVVLQTGGITEAIPDDVDFKAAIVEQIDGLTMTGKGATLDDVGNAAAFAASDHARAITATALNISAGAILD